MKLQKVKTDVTVNNYIDSNTGELLDTSVETKHTKIVTHRGDEFASIYSSIIAAMKGLSTSAKSLLTYIALKSNINTNEITLVKSKLEELSKDSELSIPTIKRNIRILVEKDILIKKGSGLYLVNPKYFWRGSADNRNKKLKYILELELNPNS